MARSLTSREQLLLDIMIPACGGLVFGVLLGLTFFGRRPPLPLDAEWQIVMGLWASGVAGLCYLIRTSAAPSLPSGEVGVDTAERGAPARRDNEGAASLASGDAGAPDPHRFTFLLTAGDDEAGVEITLTQRGGSRQRARREAHIIGERLSHIIGVDPATVQVLDAIEPPAALAAEEP
jgi:hypothetical protein